MRSRGIVVLTCVSLVALPVRADWWDAGTRTDNTEADTQNELIHGSDQLHDLKAQSGVPDVDFYRMGQNPYSSYEIVADSTSASLALQLDLVRSGSVIHSSTAVTESLGFSRSLRWENAGAAAVTTDVVRVQSDTPGCSTLCTDTDVYRLRAYETTYSIPRWNTAGQVTVVIIQNPTTYSISGHMYFWTGGVTDGTPLLSYPFTIPARQSLALNLGSLAGLTNSSGAMTISHDGRFGSLSGKAVAMDAATGYSFDTPMVAIPK